MTCAPPHMETESTFFSLYITQLSILVFKNGYSWNDQ